MRRNVQFYNASQKERYFIARENDYQMIRTVGKVFFNATSEYESKLEKDCCNFTVKEILNMYSAYASRSWEHLLNFNSQLKIYTEWCLKENLVSDNQNHYAEIDKEEMYKCLNLGLKDEMFITRKELEKTIKLEKIPNVSDQFLCLAFFEGLGGLGYKDFINLMPEQFHDGKVFLSDRELEVSELLTEKALEAAEIYDKFSYEGPLKVGYKKEDPSIIKDSANVFTPLTPERNIKKMHRRITRIEDLMGKRYGYVSLRNSGRVDMIKHLMDTDSSDDIRETYNMHKSEIENRYGKLQRVARWIEEYKRFF